MTELIALCRFDEVPEGESRGFKVGERNLFAVKQRNQLVIYHNRCPHLGIPLEWQEHRFLDESGSMIECANHSALFVIETGECVAGPCSGRKLQAIDFVVRDQQVWIAPL